MELDKSIIDIGREFAFEGLEPEYFQSNSEEETKAFNLGYNEGLRLIQEKAQKESAQQVEVESVGMKK